MIRIFFRTKENNEFREEFGKLSDESKIIKMELEETSQKLDYMENKNITMKRRGKLTVQFSKVGNQKIQKDNKWLRKGSLAFCTRICVY